jgi:hypothetical protein
LLDEGTDGLIEGMKMLPTDGGRQRDCAHGNEPGVDAAELLFV